MLVLDCVSVSAGRAGCVQGGRCPSRGRTWRRRSKGMFIPESL